MKHKRKKLTFLDYVIICSLVFFAVGLFSRYTLREKHFDSSLETEAVVSFEIHAQKKEALSNFIQDTHFKTSQGEEFGMLIEKSVRYESSKIRRVGKSGEIFELPSRSLYDLFGEVLCRGAKTEGGFFLSGVTYLAPNMHFTVKTTRASFEIYITDVKYP